MAVYLMTFCGPFYGQILTESRARISDYTHAFLWAVFTHPFIPILFCGVYSLIHLYPYFSVGCIHSSIYTHAFCGVYSRIYLNHAFLWGVFTHPFIPMLFCGVYSLIQSYPCFSVGCIHSSSHTHAYSCSHPNAASDNICNLKRPWVLMGIFGQQL